MQIDDLKLKIENKEHDDFLKHAPSKDYKMTRRDKREQKKH